MKIKTKGNNAKNKFIFYPHDSTWSINKIYKTNNTSSNIMSSKDFFNNDIKTEYKSSFIYKTINNDFSLKNNISSRNNFKLKAKKKKLDSNELRIEKVPTRLIKEIKLNLDNESINNNTIYKTNKNNSNQKFDFIKKKFLNKIKESNIFIMSNSKEEKISKLSQNINNSKYHDYNTSRYFHNEKPNSNSKNNNSCKINEIKNICQIDIFRNDRKSSNSINFNFRFNIKTDLDKLKPIESKNYRKINFNTLDTKLMISPKKESDHINKWNKLKKSENKKQRKNKEFSDININDNDLKMITKKRTFIEKDIPFKFNGFYTSKNTIDGITHNKRERYLYFIASSRKTTTKYISNKKKILIKNNKNVKNGNFSDLYIIKKSFKSDEISDLPKKDKNIIDSKKSQKLNKILLPKNNNTNKNNINKNNKKLTFSKKESKQIEGVNNEEGKISNSNMIKKVKIIKMKPTIKKESESANKIKYIHENQNNENDNLNDEELNYVFDIESEHKNAINIIKTNNFEVNKQKENNMKYTLLKDFEDEEDIKNINKSQIENIIIGKIEGYKDIIESDELNRKLELRSRSSFDIHKQTQKKIESQPQKLIKKTKNKEKYKNLANLSSKKSPFLNMHILDDNSSEIEDLDFDSNEYRINDQLLNIEKEYEFEDMTTYENETKINNDNNLLPFHVSKISFCKYYDKNDGQYKTNENIDTDIISLVQISKELNKLNDQYKDKKRTTISINNNYTKNKIITIKKNNNNKKECNLIKKTNKKNSFKKNINNNIAKSLNYQNSLKNNKNPFLNKNNIISINKINKCDFMKNKIIKYNKNNENVKRKKLKQKKLYISNKNKNDNLKIVSNYGNKDNCLVF